MLTYIYYMESFPQPDILLEKNGKSGSSMFSKMCIHVQNIWREIIQTAVVFSRGETLGDFEK